jgi:hypothetical protein
MHQVPVAGGAPSHPKSSFPSGAHGQGFPAAPNRTPLLPGTSGPRSPNTPQQQTTSWDAVPQRHWPFSGNVRDAKGDSARTRRRSSVIAWGLVAGTSSPEMGPITEADDASSDTDTVGSSCSGRLSGTGCIALRSCTISWPPSARIDIRRRPMDDVSHGHLVLTALSVHTWRPTQEEIIHHNGTRASRCQPGPQRIACRNRH